MIKEITLQLTDPRQYGKTTIMAALKRHLAGNHNYFVIKISFEAAGESLYADEATFSNNFIGYIIDTLDVNHEEYSRFLKELYRHTNLINLRELSRLLNLFLSAIDRKVILMIDEVDKRLYHSPWNIAVDFKVDMSFDTDEIATMLNQYVKESGVTMEVAVLSEKLRFYTSGYPFLVIKAIILDDATIPLVKTDNIIGMAIMYGILKADTTICAIHNKIYEQLIYEHMVARKLRENKFCRADKYNFHGAYVNDDNTLNYEKVLMKFQEYMREQYSKKDERFLERNGRLIYLAFIKPIINGHGFDFKEVQVSEERRLDVTVTFYNYKYISELKIWCGPEQHEKGLEQLAAYLEKQHADKGYLIIFDFRNKKEWMQDRQVVNGK